MPAGLRFLSIVLAILGLLGLAGCEPYMSMTNQVPAQTRQATALLSETARYVGMVNVETALRHLDDLQNEDWADSLRQADNPRLQAFLEATGIDLNRDVQAVYGAIEDKQALSAVLFANLTPEQMDRYLAAVPDEGGTATTYQTVPLYHLTFGENEADSSDTLSVAFVEEGMMAVSTHPERTKAMVDRHRAKERSGLRTNEAYMKLVKRVGHGSTAWVVGRDVVETALQDSSASANESAPPDGAPRVSRAGLQHALTEWTDRVLGLSEVSSFEGRAGKEVDRLKERLREQALSVTLTDTGLDGEVYLTMRDNASASSVVDVAEGAVAVMRLSKEDLDDRQRDLLDEIEIERRGTVVHIHFLLDRDQLRKHMGEERQAAATRRDDSSIRQSTLAIRRTSGINCPRTPFQPAPIIDATHS